MWENCTKKRSKKKKKFAEDIMYTQKERVLEIKDSRS